MATTAARVGGAVAALIGLLLGVAGLWLLTHIGTSGTASFSATTEGTRSVVLTPSVLNRLDAPVRVTITPSPGGTVWTALAAPSDAAAILGSGAHREVTGVSTRPWALQTSERGAGASPEPAEVTGADVWRAEDRGDGPVTVTVRQQDAPETLVAVAEDGSIAEVTWSAQRGTWFGQALLVTGVGVLLLAGGVVLLVRSRPRRTPQQGETS